MKPKVKIYIDGANIFYAQKKLNWSIGVIFYLEKIKDIIKREFGDDHPK